jgi:MFS family permease
MQTLGFVTGFIVISIAYRIGDFTIPLIALALVELATAIGTLLWVREGRAARDRRGRSWLAIAGSAWGLDILKERSFVLLVLSRLMFLAGLNVLLGFYVLFLERAFGFGDDEKALWVPLIGGIVALFTAAATIPSGILSNRYGRKPMIYLACAIGGLGIAVAAVAPGPELFLVGVVLMGIGSGTFVAVDWALMTDIIPKAASGRFMGISNIAVALGGPVASSVVGPLMDVVGGVTETGAGPRAAFLAGIAFFALGAVLLRPVDPRPRELRTAATALAPAT